MTLLGATSPGLLHLRRVERCPRHLVEAGHGLRPRSRGEPHVVPQRRRRIPVPEPLLRLLKREHGIPIETRRALVDSWRTPSCS
jgi:hypothetical protein